MIFFKFNFKIIVQILFVIIFFSTSNSKALDKFNKGDRISDYFSGIILLNENQYEESFKYLEKLNGLEISHKNYASKYLYTLVNSGNLKKAFHYSKKLEIQKLDSFESDIIIGIFYLKNSNKNLAQRYFLKAKNRNSRSVLNKYVSNSLYNWSVLKNINLDEALIDLNKLDQRFENLKKIQNVFLNCFFNTKETINIFDQLVNNKSIDFSRYNYFYASYVASSGDLNKAKKIIQSALKTNPSNLLLNQYKINLDENKNIFDFNCQKEEHVISEILYITANAFSSQSIFPLSNFFLNLSKFLNEDFYHYDTLLAENFYKIDNLDRAKKIYKNLNEKGEAFSWYSSKQLARIFSREQNKKKALEILSDAYNKLETKDIYVTFDYAEFLKNNEKFQEAIFYYSKIINEIDITHPLYTEVTDGRGVSYERVGEWDKAEMDLLSSLKSNPDQAYVINYLAYTWIEQGIKIEKSLEMLEKANKLKSNDPYIIDSLGWALFKLKRYKESKDYLQQAVRLMPGDPVVNDHFGDVLWKTGKEIQARYYWNYVLTLEKTENDLKQIIEKKLIRGL